MRLEMAGDAESRLLHGDAEREAGLRQGAKADRVLGSSPGRGEEEEPRVSSSSDGQSAALDSGASFRSSAAWSSSSSSLASDVESDDGDDTYPRTQCEYEEIPSFRWIATPLRWWKTKKKSTHLSRNSYAAKTEVKTRLKAGIRFVHFDGHHAFTAEDLILISASTEVLGKGTYGTVYKATLGDGNQVAVRRLSCEVVASRNFEVAVDVLGKIRHDNLMALRAYYSRSEVEKVLVFDYMPKGSLSALVQGRGPAYFNDWPILMNIAIGITKGLHHLHTRGNMVHGNLTSRNILLDDHGNAKIADYGLPHVMATDVDSEVAAVGGYLDYQAPELPMLKKANVKTDVYSLGVIILELLTGSSLRDGLSGLMPLWEVEATFRLKLERTWSLAFRCMDSSSDKRPEVLDVLHKLEEIMRAGRIYANTNPFSRRRNEATKRALDAAGTTPDALPTTSLDVDPPSSSLDTAKERTRLLSEVPISPSPLKDQPTEVEDSTPAAFVVLSTPRQLVGDSPVINSSTAQLEENNRSKASTTEDKTEASESTNGDDATSGGIRINWAEANVEVRLNVPSASSSMSSQPDLIYQSYFQTLYKLALRSRPPLPSDVLEGHLNRMVIGLHSMGYPLDTWVEAATLVLVSAKKREYIERCVNDYEVCLEAQFKEFASAIALTEEEVTRTQLNVAKLVDQLVGLKIEEGIVVDSLNEARAQLATADARIKSVSIDMDRLNQKRSARLDLRSVMLRELASVDEIFDSSFQEIMTKKF